MNNVDSIKAFLILRTSGVCLFNIYRLKYVYLIFTFRAVFFLKKIDFTCNTVRYSLTNIEYILDQRNEILFYFPLLVSILFTKKNKLAFYEHLN